MMKKLTFLLLAMILLFTLVGCDDRADKDDIFAFVRSNESRLLTAIERNDFSDIEGQSVIKDINPDARCVEFYCGGAGFGPSTKYVGFFYSPDGDMGAIWCGCSMDKLVPCGAGYEYRESDNRYYVEQICGNFYYYEASY